jgi:hypothetical protein
MRVGDVCCVIVGPCPPSGNDKFSLDHSFVSFLKRTGDRAFEVTGDRAKFDTPEAIRLDGVDLEEDDGGSVFAGEIMLRVGLAAENARMAAAGREPLSIVGGKPL